MSLILTSSSNREEDKASKINKGIENPASFQNFLKSPLIIEPNSEIALVSLKCSRDSDKVEINEGDGIFVYWGAEDSRNHATETNGYEEPTKSDDIHTPLRVELRKGTYTRRAFIQHLQARLEDVVKKAYREVSSITITEILDANNVFTGFKIQIVQVGHGSALTNKPSTTDFGAFIDKNTYRELGDDEKFQGVGYYTDNFVASASGTEVVITGYKAGAEGAICDVIGKAHPLSQVHSQAIFYFNGSSASNVTDGYTLGLVRSQGRTSSAGVKQNYGAVGGVGLVLDKDYYDQFVNVPPIYEEDDRPPFFWDVAFNWSPDHDGQVIHYINNGVEDETEPLIDSIALVNTPTNASLQAKYWDRVIFDVVGEGVTVSLGISGSGATTLLCSSASLTFGSRVKPIGQTCNQLYPKIAIHNNNATNPGVVRLTTWNGHSADAYYDNNYWGYTTSIGGSEPTSMYEKCVSNLDLNSVYGTGKKNDGVTSYVYKGDLSGNKGIDNRWVFLTGDFELSYGDLDGDYFNVGNQMETLRDDGRLQNILGFPSLMKETDYAILADSGADVSFESVNEPTFVPTSSMFVRVKNMAINTYNANKQSISNIIYSCPKFDSQGNTGGLLFYEPAERVYVKLNNVDRQVVNSFHIDIVDINEQTLDSLVGNTLVVLHIRKARY